MDSFLSLAFSATFFVGLARQLQLGLNRCEGASHHQEFSHREEKA